MERIKYPRYLFDQINNWLFQEKVIIVYGPRQVGKTTLCKEFIDGHPNSLYLNCEQVKIKDVLESGNLENIRAYLGGYKLVVFDEAQKIKQIGGLLKLLNDTYPEIQIIATGSSSFELSNEITEPLTGRNIKFIMYPVSLSEVSGIFNPFEIDEKIEGFLRFGMYSDILEKDDSQKTTLLDMLAPDYLFRDILNYENLKQPELLVQLLKAIALQLGSEVSFRELAVLLKTTVETIQRYLDILERSFVLFHLTSFSRNLRSELTRSRKYYFYDTGIRNSLIQNYNMFTNRNDIGAEWENFCITERMKFLQKEKRKANLNFWRTYQQNEIDLIEESGGVLTAVEFKWNPKAKAKFPKEFLTAYPNSQFKVVHSQNFRDFLMG
jgi:predicted AAA+ superfamily ATPase